MLCHRCGSHVPDSTDTCPTCGLRYDAAARQAAGAARRRGVEGAPYKPGDIVSGRYAIQEVVGSGPTGFVFRAQDQEIDVEVALKAVHPRLVQQPEERTQFSFSMRTGKKLNHPNLLRVYEEGVDGERPFFTMQLLEGMTLRRMMEQRVARGQLFSMKDVEPLLAQMAAALDAAHRFGPHSDLKPENVIVLPDLLKVTDYGLGLAVPQLPFVQAQKGQRADVYIAPEYVNGSELDTRMDVYSLGVIMGELLTGLLPVDGGTPELMVHHPDLPPALESLYRRALNPNPLARPKTAGELHAEFASILSRTPAAIVAHARSVPPPPGSAASANARAAFKPLPPVPTDMLPVPSELMTPKPAPVASAPPRPAEPRPVPGAGARQEPAPPPDATQPLDAETLAAIMGGPHPSRLLTEQALPFIRPPSEPEPAPRAPAAPAPSVPWASSTSLPSVQDAGPRAAQESAQRASAVTQEAGPRVPPASQEPGYRGSAAAQEASPRGSAAPQESAHRASAASQDPGYRGAAASQESAQRASAAPQDSASRAGGGTSQPTPRAPAPRGSSPAASAPRGPGPTPRASGPVASLQSRASSSRQEADSRADAKTLDAAPSVPSSARADAKTLDAAPSVPSSARADAKTLDAAPSVPSSARAGGRSPAHAQESGGRSSSAHSQDSGPVSVGRSSAAQTLDAGPSVSGARASARTLDSSPSVSGARSDARTLEPSPAVSGARSGARMADSPVMSGARSGVRSGALPTLPVTRAAKAKTRSMLWLVLLSIAGLVVGAGGTFLVLRHVRRPVMPAPLTPTPVKPAPPGEGSGAQPDSESGAGSAVLTAPSGQCPEGMQLVSGGAFNMGDAPEAPAQEQRRLPSVQVQPFCVDAYEYPNRAGARPQVQVSWDEARALCERVGKRLCSEAEWEKACKGPGNQRFPYGKTLDSARCNTAPEGTSAPALSASGRFSQCRSGYSVMDLSGNVAEWTATPDGQGAYLQKGGAFDQPSLASRCGARKSGAAGERSGSLGFRCCAGVGP